MDQVLVRQRSSRKMAAVMAVAGLTASVIAWATISAPASQSARLNIRNVELGEAAYRSLRESTPLRGVFMPRQSRFLDTEVGGRVEKVLVKGGELVQEGQVILELSNASLQLDIISREAQIVEQLNNLQSTRLAIEQNQLSLQRDVANFDYQITRLRREAKQQEVLVQKKLISQDVFQRTREELAYQQRARDLTLASQKIDNAMRETLVGQLEKSSAQQQRNLEVARRNYDSLIVRAPASGRLTSLKAELGANMVAGERLGQIDALSEFKVVAWVDEFYLGQVGLGEKAKADLAGQMLELILNHIDPEVKDGKFQVEFSLPAAFSAEVRRGQNITLELALSEEARVLSIPNGGFVGDTGGRWAFVLDPDGKTAHRRELILGRKTTRHVEVLSGLSPGERLVVSPYGDSATLSAISLTQE
ncbi:MAG: HlyD family efflux transporter periplasmic adaptor subunit [Gammaproteobacteria bacterium]|nr:HlyD family efflux transporter periplasmic adaptor subunit [Gammaproteobacteria bacterium]